MIVLDSEFSSLKKAQNRLILGQNAYVSKDSTLHHRNRRKYFRVNIQRISYIYDILLIKNITMPSYILNLVDLPPPT